MFARFGCFLFAFIGDVVRNHLSPLHFRRRVDLGDVGEPLREAVKHGLPLILIGYLPALEDDRGLDLVSILNECSRVSYLKVKIVRIRVWMETYLFDLSNVLVLLLELFLFRQLVFVFAEIHDLANRGIRSRHNLDQIQSLSHSDTDRLTRRENADLLSFFVNNPDLRRADFGIDSCSLLLDGRLSYRVSDFR